MFYIYKSHDKKITIKNFTIKFFFPISRKLIRAGYENLKNLFARPYIENFTFSKIPKSSQLFTKALQIFSPEWGPESFIKSSKLSQSLQSLEIQCTVIAKNP